MPSPRLHQMERHTTPEEFGAYVKSEFDKWQKVVKESGATAN